MQVPFEMSEQTTEAYRPKYDWELKKSDLSTMQKRQAKGALWGVRRERKCFFCGIPFDPRVLFLTATIHHEARIGEVGCNLLPHLHLAHFGCNSAAGPAKGIQKMREREKVARVGGEMGMFTASSTEMARSLKMRPRWNNWIDGKPFVQIQRKRLAKMAVHELGLGSSITYDRYIGEDIEGGILTEFEIEGESIVKLNEEADTRMMREQKEREMTGK